MPSRDFSVAFPKNSFLGFCHLPIKPDPLNPKMAFLFGFEPSKAPKTACKVSPFDISPAAPARSNPEIPGDQAGQCRQAGRVSRNF